MSQLPPESGQPINALHVHMACHALHAPAPYGLQASLQKVAYLGLEADRLLPMSQFPPVSGEPIT